MRLLAITNDPEGCGFRQRVSVYLPILRQRGIECDVAKLPKGELQRAKLFRMAADFDGVLLHKKKLSRWNALLLRRYCKKLIYTFDDAIMYKDTRPEVCSRSHSVPFRRTARMADLIIVGSDHLAEHARRFNDNVEVLPLGLPVDDYEICSAGRKDNKVRLVWIGSRSSLGYLAQLSEVLREIAGRFPQVVLRVIADQFLDIPGVPVETMPWSLENRRAGLATSDIGLAPLPNNAFTQGKCTFKVLEYSASGLPVIASPVATHAAHIVADVTGFLAEDRTEWSDRISQLIEDPPLRKRMGRQGRTWAWNYDVRVIGPQLACLLRNCLGCHSRPA